MNTSFVGDVPESNELFYVPEKLKKASMVKDPRPPVEQAINPVVILLNVILASTY